MVLQNAANSLEDESLRPITVSSFKLRDALKTSLLVRSLRRAQEFTEFTVQEWNERSQTEQETFIKIKVHKTMSYGRADIVLNNVEEKAFKAYSNYLQIGFLPCIHPLQHFERSQGLLRENAHLKHHLHSQEALPEGGSSV